MDLEFLWMELAADFGWGSDLACRTSCGGWSKGNWMESNLKSIALLAGIANRLARTSAG